ncbi:hypothetical protein [Azospirillum halopraeferens]|uniref:hypothetical protein n=1 Tax=Azospirillum halopraeferens TaxID=34010 RepID=UPI00040B76C8|nr:hypothetical protein [Azospirillum halopraeferens]
MLTYTKHAQKRAKGRAIPETAIELVSDFGKWRRRGQVDVVFLDRKSRARLRRHIGGAAYKDIERKLRSYVVYLDDGSIKTVAYRLGRMKTA